MKKIDILGIILEGFICDLGNIDVPILGVVVKNKDPVRFLR